MVLEVRLSYMWLDGISRSYRLEEATGVRKLWLCKSVCFAPSLASTSTFWFLHAVSDFFSFSHNIAGSFNKALPLPLIAALCQALALQVSVKAPMFLFPLTTEQLSTPRSSHLGYLLQTEGELAIFSTVAPLLSLSAFLRFYIWMFLHVEKKRGNNIYAKQNGCSLHYSHPRLFYGSHSRNTTKLENFAKS